MDVEKKVLIICCWLYSGRTGLIGKVISPQSCVSVNVCVCACVLQREGQLPTSAVGITASHSSSKQRIITSIRGLDFSNSSVVYWHHPFYAVL